MDPRGSASKGPSLLSGPTLACSHVPNQALLVAVDVRGWKNRGKRHKLTAKERQRGGGRGESEGRRKRIERKRKYCRAALWLLCVSLNGEHDTDTKGSEGKQCRLTRHHWLIISNLLRA